MSEGDGDGETDANLLKLYVSVDADIIYNSCFIYMRMVVGSGEERKGGKLLMGCF